MRDVDKTILWIDEVQTEDVLGVAASCGPFSLAIASGDGFQGFSAGRFRRSLSAAPVESELLYACETMPVQSRSAILWASENKYVQCIDNLETVRFGQPLLHHLQFVFPFLQGATSARLQPNSILFMPTLFVPHESRQPCSDDEIDVDADILEQFLVLLSVEVVVAKLTGVRNRRILVIFYLHSV